MHLVFELPTAHSF